VNRKDNLQYKQSIKYSRNICPLMKELNSLYNVLKMRYKTNLSITYSNRVINIPVGGFFVSQYDSEYSLHARNYQGPIFLEFNSKMKLGDQLN
jgi:hypothetical protein